MKGDFTRQTFDASSHFTTVRMQQGRVQLDADWNEQADLVLRRDEVTAADVIGGCGGPLGAAGFAITLDGATGDFTLGPGRYYVAGTLCEIEEAVRYTAQPDLPGLAPLAVAQAGFTVVYLEVWQRHLTWLDDPRLRETALGGPDTATRTRTVWQVRTVFAGTGATTCADDPAAYLAATAAGTGRLAARARSEASEPDPCLVPASAGYRGLENQLYRVEVHEPGDAYDLAAGPGDQSVTVAAPDKVVYAGGSWSVGQSVEIFRSATGSDPMEGFAAVVVADDSGTKTLTLNRTIPSLTAADAPRIRPVDSTFKWSRDNGSVVSRVVTVTGRDVVVESLGPDEALGFAQDQLAELSDEVTELNGRPGFLARIESIDPASGTVTLQAAPPAFTGEVLKLRRWDGVGAVKTHPAGGAEPFIELEDGVQVGFTTGSYRSGDHWLVPARTATALAQSGTVEWPVEGGAPVQQPPAGIRRRSCKLAVLHSNGSAFTVEDCRSLFPPLTELTTLAYVGGDGQEARPGQALPKPLEAGVFRGRHPVAGATVRFTTGAGGKLAADTASLPAGGTTFSAVTDANGVAACAWLPANDLARLGQGVEARLLNAGGAELPQRLHFTAQLSVAAEVAYVPGACAGLAAADTVQEALDILCLRPSGAACCRVVEAGSQLDEVIKELVESGERHVCLCLKGGEHKLEKVELGPEQLDTLTIQSCGGGARVITGSMSLHGLAAVDLRGFETVLVTDGALRFDRCARVAIDDCEIRRTEVAAPVALIGGAERVRVARSILAAGAGVDEAHPDDDIRGLIAVPGATDFAARSADFAERVAPDAAGRKDMATRISRATRLRRLSGAEQAAYRSVLAELADDAFRPEALVAAFGRLRLAAAFARAVPALVLLDGGAEALIDASDLMGGVVLYGERPGDVPTPDGLKEMRAHVAQGAITFRGTGSLHIRDSRLTRVAAADKVMAELAAGQAAVRCFRAIHLTDTEVLASPSAFVGEDVTLTALDFDDGRSDAGALIAASGIVTGTRAPNDVRLFVVTAAAATTANLRINVVQP
jgi:hypothetical protein